MGAENDNTRQEDEVPITGGQYPGQDGLSMVKKRDKDAGESGNQIVVINASNTMQGIGMEYACLEEKFGRRGVDWKLEMQTLVQDSAAKSFDRLTIKLMDGSKKDILFDINSFFGKG